MANGVARRIVAAPHRPGGQAQFVEQPVLLDPTDDAVGRACAWATAHLAEPLTMDVLAGVAHLSRSSLTRAFRARTGVPVLVNTSFNTRGEPIVCTPRDAIESFWTSPLDALVIGSFLLEKPGQGGL